MDPSVEHTFAADKFTIVECSKDGYCTVSSIVTCLKNTDRHFVHSKTLLLEMIKGEIMNNLPYYGEFLELDEYSVRIQLDQYIRGDYGTSVGDVVIIALDVTIFILTAKVDT